MYTSETSVREPRPFEVEVAIEKQKSYKSPGTDQGPEEMIQARGNTL
jgi:hypothetical protein